MGYIIPVGIPVADICAKGRIMSEGDGNAAIPTFPCPDQPGIWAAAHIADIINIENIVLQAQQCLEEGVEISRRGIEPRGNEIEIIREPAAPEHGGSAKAQVEVVGYNDGALRLRLPRGPVPQR